MVTALQPLDRRGRLGGDIVGDAVHTLHFVRNTRGNPLQDLRRENIPVCQVGWSIIFSSWNDNYRGRTNSPISRHEILSLHRTQRNYLDLGYQNTYAPRWAENSLVRMFACRP